MKHKILYMSALMALSTVTPAVAQNDAESDSTVNVAFRTVDKQDMLGGISVIDMKELQDKAYSSYSLDYIDNVVGGFNGNIWGNTEYLVVVDGMVRDANNVLPTEIDQVTLLKGAQAVVLYGPRAAKGVLQITTKRGKEGDLRINVHANGGLYTPKSYPKYLGSAEYMSYYNQARYNDDPTVGHFASYSAEDIYHFASGENPYRYPDFDMYSSDYLRKAYGRYEGILEVTGGNERMKYYTTTGYYRESSQLKVGNAKDNYNSRFFVRGNIDVKLNDFLSAKADANVTFYDAFTAKTDWWGQAATLRPHLVSPLIPMSYIEATDVNSLATVLNSNYLQGDMFLGGTQANPTNPYADAFAAGDNKYVSRQFQFNTEFDVKLDVLTKGLMFRARYGIDYASTYNQGYSNSYATFSPAWTNYAGTDMIASITQYGNDKKTGDEYISNSAYRYTYNVSGQFDYTNTFAEKHNVFGMFLGNIWQTQQSGRYHRKTNVNLGLQLSYNYDHTYYVDFSAAIPYSTKLPEGNRTSISPVFTLGWRPTKDVLKDTFVDDLMLTASVGTVCQDLDIAISDNEDESYYLYKPIVKSSGWYSWGDNSGLAATGFDRSENLEMTYVKRKEFTVGLRGSLWNKLITFDFNFFTNTMDGGLVRTTSPYPNYFTQVGYPSSSIIPYINYNIDKRVGIDFSVYASKKFGDFDLTLGVSGMWYKSTADKRDENYEYAYRSRVGQALNGYWGLESEGLFQSQTEIDAAPTQTFGDVKPGDIRYKDQNGDGKIDSNDEVFLARWDSPFMSGINFTLKWKNFTFFALGNLYLGGHGMKDNSYYWLRGTGKYSEIARDSWTPENPGAAYPRLTTTNGENNYRYSDFWMYSNDRFNLRKVQLTYSIPGMVFENSFAKFVKGIDVYVSGNSLLTIAKERKILEMNVGSAPQTRYYSIGFKAMF